MVEEVEEEEDEEDCFRYLSQFLSCTCDLNQIKRWVKEVAPQSPHLGWAHERTRDNQPTVHVLLKKNNFFITFF